MDVNIIDYKMVNYNIDILLNTKNKFSIVEGIKDRRELFYRSFERFYLLRNAMELYNLKNVLFMEIDNLIYDDPTKWLTIFKNNNINIAFMIDNIRRVSTGICYLKEINSIKKITDFFDTYYLKNKPEKKFLNEMSAIYEFYTRYNSDCFILPSSNYFDKKFPIISSNFYIFDSIFDPSSYGIYLLGYDTYHTSGKIVLHNKNKWGYITPTKNIQWINIDGFKKPYILLDNKKIIINNLHVHSKDLLNGLSKPFE
jgi:hypothetical protein